MKPFRYVMPTEVVLEPGCAATLADRCRRLGRKPLVATGRHSAKASGALDLVRSQFPEAVVFAQVEENPTTDTCAEGARMCREKGCDFLVGLGGGSPIDAAKAIAMLATNAGGCSEYFGFNRFPNAPLPVVAIPTTAGTGSEVTPYAVLVEPRERMKRTIAGRGLFPALALLDPELSVTMPAHVTRNTGLDALSQAMEGMVATRSTPMGDSFALDTCQAVRQWLPVALDEPRNIEARSQMLYAAMLSGCIIAQSGTTLVHAMGYFYTVEFGLAHGLANALLLAPLFRHNARVAPGKVAALAAALGAPAAPTPEAAGDAIVQALYGLFQTVGLSPAARDAGVEPQRFPEFAERLKEDAARFRNQPGELSHDDILRLFQESYEGVC